LDFFSRGRQTFLDPVFEICSGSTMKNTLSAALLLVVFSLCTIAWSATTEEPASAAEAATPHLDKGTVVVTEFDGGRIHTLVAPEEVVAPTSHVIETDAHLVVVDTQLTLLHSRQLRELCDALQKPIERVIVTHGHPDHYFGIGAFSDVPVYASPKIRNYIQRRHRFHQSAHKKMEGDHIPDEIQFPTHDLVAETLDIDGVELKLEVVADAEDVEQVVVDMPAARILIVQDLVSNGYHAFIGTGPVEPWVQTLRGLAAREPAVVLAGHGVPGGVELFEDTAQYLEGASRLADEATSRQGLIDAVLAAYPERKGPFLVEISAQIIFRDRERQQNASSS
jgi:glyoxylase-like metal-dependent hydrolase (beta-lactamase superfamily II)